MVSEHVSRGTGCKPPLSIDIEKEILLIKRNLLIQS